MEKYKRYLVFGISQYYPSGGLYDIILSADTFEELRERIAKNKKGIIEYISDTGHRHSDEEYQVFDCQERIEINLEDILK